MSKVIALEEQYCANNYSPLPVVITKAKDVWAWDEDGKKYLDMMSAYSAVSHGHANPEILAVLNEQAKILALPSRAFYNEHLGPLMKKLTKLSGLDRGIPMNTGAEAVETAIKAARRWGYEKKKVPEGCAEIITMAHNFHGRTSTIISFSSEPSYRRGFGPFMPGFVEVAFGDVEAIEEEITNNTCAVLVEPVQGEAGIVVPPKGWLKQVEELCRKHNVLLIADEVQTGLGRTGKMFAVEHEKVKPDGLILGKALGGGVYPVSAFLGTQELMEVFDPGSHGSTFGGNPLGCAIACKALELLEKEDYIKNAAELGKRLISNLGALEHPMVKEVRGLGLLVGVEFDREQILARDVCMEMLKNGVLSKETHETVVRFAPPLTITEKDLLWGIKAFEKSLKALS